MTKEEKKSIISHHEKQYLPSTDIKSGGILTTAIANLSSAQNQELLNTAANEALGLEVIKEKMQINHYAGQTGINSHINTFNTMDKSGKTNRHKVKSKIKTASGTMEIESKSGAACFVATVAYSDENHPSVEYLRQFRDSALIKSKQGQKFIMWYYTNGPFIADFIAPKKGLIRITRVFLNIVVTILKFRFQF